MLNVYIFKVLWSESDPNCRIFPDSSYRWFTFTYFYLRHPKESDIARKKPLRFIIFQTQNTEVFINEHELKRYNKITSD